MNPQRLAKLLSVVFGPQGWLPLLFVLVLVKSGLNRFQLVTLVPLVFTLQVILPIILLYIIVRLKWATAWDLPKREERYRYLGLIIVCNLTSLLLVYKLGNPLLFHLEAIIFIQLLLIALITRFWKISYHSSLTTSSVILINFLFGWTLPFLYLLIPVVFWIRLTLKRHNFYQLIAGMLLSIIVNLGGLKYFGYL